MKKAIWFCGIFTLVIGLLAAQKVMAEDPVDILSNVTGKVTLSNSTRHLTNFGETPNVVQFVAGCTNRTTGDLPDGIQTFKVKGNYAGGDTVRVEEVKQGACKHVFTFPVPEFLRKFTRLKQLSNIPASIQLGVNRVTSAVNIRKTAKMAAIRKGNAAAIGGRYVLENRKTAKVNGRFDLSFLAPGSTAKKVKAPGNVKFKPKLPAGLDPRAKKDFLADFRQGLQGEKFNIVGTFTRDLLKEIMKVGIPFPLAVEITNNGSETFTFKFVKGKVEDAKEIAVGDSAIFNLEKAKEGKDTNYVLFIERRDAEAIAYDFDIKLVDLITGNAIGDISLLAGTTLPIDGKFEGFDRNETIGFNITSPVGLRLTFNDGQKFKVNLLGPFGPIQPAVTGDGFLEWNLTDLGDYEAVLIPKRSDDRYAVTLDILAP